MNGIKKKYIAYIMIGTILIYGIVRYFNVVEGYIKNITKALIPFVVGAIMAYIINILMDAYEDLLLKKFHNKKIDYHCYRSYNNFYNNFYNSSFHIIFN